MGLSFQPESYEALNKRFPKALWKVWPVTEFFSLTADRPGRHRENVFDTTDGMRLIISVSKYKDLMVLFVSCTPQNGPMGRVFKDKVHGATAQTIKAIRAITGMQDVGIAELRITKFSPYSHLALEWNRVNLLYKLDQNLIAQRIAEWERS